MASVWLAVACSLVGAGVGLRAENLLLISIDTLRADRLSCYGYNTNRTPGLDRWAEEGVIFDSAYTEYPLTLPAHYTMLTGVYPCNHGARENVGYRVESDRETLAEVLRERGFETAAFIGAYVLASEFGFGQGFDVFDEEFASSIESVSASTQVQRPAEQVTDRFLAWLEEHQQNQFFAFVHFYDPHTPRPYGYDREVSNVDRSIERIDRFLRSRGLLEKTHVFVTSDHGEGLGDHGESGHGFFLYDSTTRIPLIFRPAVGYSASAKRVATPVSLADLMPTILRVMDIPWPAGVQGRSLTPLFQGRPLRRDGVYSETFIPELHFGWAPLRSFRLRGYKYVEAPRPELYEINTDPSESRDLSSQKGDLGRAYRSNLLDFVSKFAAEQEEASQGEVDREARERLAALGYVSLQPPRRSAEFGGIIDPKDRILVFEEFHGILNDLSNRRANAATLPRIDRLHEMAPEIEGVNFLKAWCLELVGRTSEAEERYRLALEEQPEHVMARSRLASLLVRLGRVSEAETQMLETLRVAPGDYKTRNNLAGLYHKTGRMDAALAEMKTITRERPRYSAAWQNLGLLCIGKRDWEEAETAFRKVIELNQENAIAHFNLARVLRELGREKEAEKELEIALELDPRLKSR